MLQSLIQAVIATRAPAPAGEPGDAPVSGGFAQLVDQLDANLLEGLGQDGNVAPTGKLVPTGKEAAVEGKLLPDGMDLAAAELAGLVASPDDPGDAAAPLQPPAEPASMPAPVALSEAIAIPVVVATPSGIQAPIAATPGGSETVSLAQWQPPQPNPAGDEPMAQLRTAPGIQAKQAAATWLPGNAAPASPVLAAIATPATIAVAQDKLPLAQLDQALRQFPASGEPTGDEHAKDKFPRRKETAPLGLRQPGDAPSVHALLARSARQGLDAARLDGADSALARVENFTIRGEFVAGDGRASLPDGSLHAPAAATRQALPQDFSELVDRLVAAREAASPRIVQAALSHGEFGTVSLQLNSQADQLRVTMSSADPGFAPAAQAAALAAASAGPEGDTSRQGGQYQPAGGGTSGGGLSGDASEASQKREGQTGSQENSPLRPGDTDQSQDTGNTLAKPSGIYA